MTAENDPIENLYARTLRTTNMMLDRLEQQLAPPAPLPRKIPFSDDPGVCAARRWMSDQFALWMFCENAGCMRAGRCRGRYVACYRHDMDRVPDDAFDGLKFCLAAREAGEDPLTLRGERGRCIAALVDWRRRFGLHALPTRASLAAAARAGKANAT